jgi:hypothetical protein
MPSAIYTIEYSDVHGYVFKTINLGTFTYISEQQLIDEYDLHCKKFDDRNIKLYKDDELLKAHYI